MGADRGHQAPLAAFANTVFWRSTNILSNITPQKSALKRGAWKNLETAVRGLAYTAKEIYVVTGPLYDPNENQMTLPRSDEPHTVPTAYWKVVWTKGGAMTALVFDQDVTDTDHCNGIVTLADVELQTGLDLFPEAAEWPTSDLSAQLGCPA